MRSLVGGFDFGKNRVLQPRDPGQPPAGFLVQSPSSIGCAGKGHHLDDGHQRRAVFFPLRRPAAGLGTEKLRRQVRGADAGEDRPGEIEEHGVDPRAARSIGPSYAQDYITSSASSQQHPALSDAGAGSGPDNPMQMAAAYSVFANGGYRIKPYFIKKIVDPKGTVIFEETPAVAGKDAEQAIDPRNAFIMTTMLRGCGACQHRYQGDGAPAAIWLAKTGTTNDSVDAWFAGFQPVARWRGLGRL